MKARPKFETPNHISVSKESAERRSLIYHYNYMMHKKERGFIN